MPARTKPQDPEPAAERDAQALRRITDLWTFVPVADYERPTLPARSAAAQAWCTVRDFFRAPGSDDEAPAKQEEELRSLSELRLEHLVAPIDWQQVALALDEALAERAPAADARRVVFVIGQPHCGHGEVVEAWAARHMVPLIGTPGREQILAGGADWPGVWPEAGSRWALPRLEHCFLRHDSGLALVRRLFERIAGGDAGTGVIGCDSWSWAFLQRVWPLSGIDALTLQAFDASRLSWLFADLAERHPHRPLHFRNARTGRATLTVPHEDDAVGDEIVQLAAHCRGNVGIARQYWRWRLRAEPEVEPDPGAPEPSEDPHDEVVWVSARIEEPVLPTETDEDVALLLHAVLLHGGLMNDALPDVLPLAPHRCTTVARRLEQLALIELRQGRWFVAPLAYALVRQWLCSRDYLHDEPF
jgi:hypothetical protein